MRNKYCFLTGLFLLPLFLCGQGCYPYSQFRKGISQIQLTCIQEDKNNNLWIGTKEGINIFNQNTGLFENSKQNPKLSNAYIYNVEKDKTGKIWYIDERAFYCEDGRIILHEKGKVSEFRFDKNNRLFFRNNTEEKVYIQENGKIRHVNELYPTLPLHLNQILWDETRECIVLVGKEKIYALNTAIDSVPIPAPMLAAKETAGFGLIECDNHKIYLGDNKQIIDPFTHKIIFRLCQGQLYNNFFQIDAKGNIYFLQNTRLMKYDTTTKKGIDFGTNFLLPKKIFFAKNGAVYLITEEGLIKYTGENLTYYGKEHKVKNPWSIVTEKNGNLWYSGYEIGLFRLDKNTDKFTEIHAYEKLKPLRENKNRFYIGAIRDDKGDLFFPSEEYGGLLQFDGKDFSIANKDTHFIPLSMCQDRANDRYIIGAYNLFTMDKKGKCTLHGNKAMMRSYYLSMTQDLKGNFWLGGTYDLLRWDGKDKFERIRQTNGDSVAGLALHTDYKGTVWTGNGKHRGLWYYNENTKGDFKQILAHHCQKSVLFIGSIDSSYLLIGSREGLYILDLQQFYENGAENALLYSEENGNLIGRECGQNGLHKANDSLFYFTTEDAIMRLDAAKFRKSIKEISWGIDSVFENSTRQALYCNRVRSVLSVGEAAPTLSENHFTYFHNNIDIFFHKNLHENYTLSYRLQCLSDSSLTRYGYNVADYELHLKNVAPGRYKLFLYPELSYEGMLHTAPVEIEFRIHSFWHFWRWFVLPVLLLLGAIVYFIRRFWKVKRANMEFQRQRKLHAFQIQSIANSVNAHFFNNVLGNINGLAYLFAIPKGRLDFNTIVVSIAKMQRLLYDKFPFWSLKEEIHFLHLFLAIEHIRYPFEFRAVISPEIDLENIQIPKTIVQSLVENSITYGATQRIDKNGMITLTLTPFPAYIEISITDNGPGSEEAKSNAIVRSGQGNAHIRAYFALLNQYKPAHPFSFEAQNITDTATSEIKGFRSRILLPHPFTYPTI